MDYVILDLEWNSAYSRERDGFLNEIIEFGAVKVDRQMNKVDVFSRFVRPSVGEKLQEHIQSLTHISSEDLAGGVPFLQALEEFRRFLDGAPLMTWSTSDILTLMDNYYYYTESKRLPFLTGYIDLQSYCEHQLHYEQGKQIGLSTAAQLLGISEEGMMHHRALDDSLLAFECLKKLYDPQEFCLFEQRVDDRFYEKICFKTVTVRNLSSPLVKPSYLTFSCEQCGRKARRISGWEFRGGGHNARFRCPHCGTEFIGRVQMKLKYEGLTVKKKRCPVPKDTDHEASADDKDNGKEN